MSRLDASEALRDIAPHVEALSPKDRETLFLYAPGRPGRRGDRRGTIDRVDTFEHTLSATAVGALAEGVPDHSMAVEQEIVRSARTWHDSGSGTGA